MLLEIIHKTNLNLTRKNSKAKKLKSRKVKKAEKSQKKYA